MWKGFSEHVILAQKCVGGFAARGSGLGSPAWVTGEEGEEEKKE